MKLKNKLKKSTIKISLKGKLLEAKERMKENKGKIMRGLGAIGISLMLLTGISCSSPPKLTYQEEIIFRAIDVRENDLAKKLIETEKEKINKIRNPKLYSCTLLHYAAISENLEMVKYLVKQGADPYARDENGATILHYAAITGNMKIINYIVSKAPSLLNAVDNFGKGAEYYARNGRKPYIASYIRMLREEYERMSK